MSKLEQLKREMWLARRLRQYAHVFDGETNIADRRERVRRAILSAGYRAKLIGRRKNGKSLTYADAFEAIYREPLEKRAA